jgi:hypothetical protein
MQVLEARYRRLLAWYPVAHRASYGEEMIGVLLAGASSGQRRPGVAEILDLISGALRVRIRAALTQCSGRGWLDALAAASLLAGPLMIVLLGQNLGWMGSLLWHSAPQTGRLPASLWPLAVLLLPLALGLLGLRRTAAASAVLLMTWVIVQAALGLQLQQPRLAAYLVLFGVQALALAASPGPKRGLQLLSAKAAVMSVPWLGAAAYAGGIMPTHYPVPLVVAEIGIGLTALAGLPALAAPTGRRLIVLLAVIPGSAFAVSLLTFANVNFYSMSFAASQFALYLPPVMLAGLTILAIRRPGGDRASEAGQGES